MLNYQKQRWKKFFQAGGVDTVFEDYFRNCEYNGIRISAKPDVSQVTELQRQKLYGVQERAPLYVTFTVENVNNHIDTAAVTYPAVKLLDIPLYAEDGFKQKTSTVKPVSRLEYASGWYIDKSDKKSYDNRLVYRNRYGRVFYFTNKGSVYSANSSKNMPVLRFLKAVTGYTFDELQVFYNDIPGFLKYFFSTKELSYEECCAEALSILRENRAYSLGTAITELNNLLFEWIPGRAGDEKIPRYLDMESFHRCHGMKIKNIVGTDKISVNTVITSEIAEKMDKECRITECTLEDENGKKHVIKRCYAEDFNRNLTPKEILYAYYQYLLFLNGIGEMHDEQELSNLILEPIDEVAKRCIELALNKAMEKIRMNIDNNKVNPVAEIEKVFAKLEDREKSQFDIISRISDSNINRTVDITNTISEVDLSGKVKRENANSQRDVHPSHYGRLDMNDTPESEEVGLTISLCVHSDIDKYGFITTPLYKVVDGAVDTSETVYLSYLEEKWQYIAPVGAHLENYGPDDLVPNCTLNGETVSVIKKLITYQRRQSEDLYGSTLNTVPGVTWNGIKRYTLASSGFKQACPLLKPERPYLSTGFNKNDAGVVRTKDIVTEYFATLGKYDVEVPKDITIRLGDLRSNNNTVEAIFIMSKELEGVSTIKYTTMGVSRSMTNTMRQFKLANSDKDHLYHYDDIVFHSNDVLINERGIEKVADSIITPEEEKKISDHDIALGQNLRVLFKTFEGFGYEDSIQLNRRFVDKFGLATIHTVTVTADNSKKDPGTHMEFTKILKQGGKVINWLNDDGLPKIGTYLKPGDVVIGRMLVNDSDSSKSIPKPIKLTVNQEGYVWFAGKQLIKDSNSSYERIEVTLAKILPLDVGDKVTGGHGNKATCSRILEEHEMPYFEDGTTPDIIFDPLGCIARENVGQITECLLAEIGRTQNKTMVINHGTPVNPDELMAQAESCGVTQQTLYNPKTGEPYREKAFIGTMNIVRSTHTCFSKYMAMGSHKGKTSINFQPTREGAEHAQRISEMTTWCYRASGAEEVLNTLFTLQSDDLNGHNEMFKAISRGEDLNISYSSINGFRIQAYLRFFGINLKIDEDNNTYLEPINSEKALELASGNVISVSGPRDREALSNYEIFGEQNPPAERLKDNLQKYGLIKISKPIIHPIFLTSKEFTGCIPTVKISTKVVKDGNGDVLYYKDVLKFEGLKPSEIQKIFRERSDKDAKYFGRIDSGKYIDTTVEGAKVTLTPGLFVLADSKEDAMRYGCSNAERGGNHFFDVIASTAGDAEENETLKNSLALYQQLYLESHKTKTQDLDDAEYDKALSTLSKSEDAIYRDEDADADYNSAEDSAELSSMLTGYKDDHMRLEEMLNTTPYNLLSFMTQYIMVPPLALRPVTGEHGTYRAFSRVLSNVLGKSTGDVMSIYMMLATELKPAKKKKGSQKKTIITELTAHKNKSSVIRDNMLAKPVSYSGRSVISVDPTLKLGTCKVPALMLVTIFMEHLLALIPSKDDYSIYARVKDDSREHYGNGINKGKAKALLNGIVNGDLASSVGRLKIIDEFPCAGEKGKELSIKTKQKEFNKLKTELYTMLTDLAEKYPAILSRDPALWLLSVRGHKFIPSEGYTIRIHPLVCMGFNADFDGDQMSCIFPMHVKARKTLGKTMMVGSTLINPQEGTSCFVFEQDILMGHFFATEKGPDTTLSNITDVINIKGDGEFIDRYKYSEILSLYDKIDIGRRNYSDTIIVRYKDKKYLTTVGRLMFNVLYPFSYVFLDEEDNNGFYKLRFEEINKSTSKEFTKWILQMQQSDELQNYPENEDDIFQNNYGLSGCVMDVADRLMSFGFAAADMSGTTLSYWDFANLRDKRIDTRIAEATKEAEQITTRRKLGLLDEEMANARLRDIWGETQKFSEDILGEKLNSNPNLYNMIRSGARGSTTNINHICGFIGTVINNSGEELPEPIKGNYLCGLTNEEVSTNAFDGRRIKLQTQGGSSVQGEKTRKLVYLLEHFKIHEEGDTKTCDAKPTRLKLNYVLQENKIPVGKTGAVQYNPEPTTDMTPEEVSNWERFINKLTDLGLPKCPGEIANKLMKDYGVTQISVVGVSEGVKPVWKIQAEHRNMLWYRTVSLDTMNVNWQQHDRIRSCCIADSTLDSTNYILTHEAIDAIERMSLPYVDFYTMIGCENHDGTICPRCFGYRYEDCKYPQDNEQIGYTVAGVIGQRGLQSAQNLHKSGGSGSSKNIDIYSMNANVAFTSPGDLNIKVTGIPENEIMKYYLGAIKSDFSFPESMTRIEGNTIANYRTAVSDPNAGTNTRELDVIDVMSNEIDKEVSEFKRLMSTVAKADGTVEIHNIENTIVVSVYSNEAGGNHTWFPLWNQAIKLAVSDGAVVHKGDSLIELPSMHDLLKANNTSTGQTLMNTQRELAMQMWYTVLKTMTSGGGFAARNFELTTKAFNEVGMALEPNKEHGIVTGRNYPIYRLNNAGVQYKAVIPSDFHLMQAREKVFTALAKGHFATKACSCCVRKVVNEPSSSISDAVVGIDRAKGIFPRMTTKISIEHNDMSKIVNEFVASKGNRALGMSQPDVVAIEDKHIEEPIKEVIDATPVEVIDATPKTVVTEEKPIDIEVIKERIDDVKGTAEQKPEEKNNEVFDELDVFFEEDSKYPAKRKRKKKKGADSTSFFDD